MRLGCLPYRFPGRKLLLFGTMLPILVPSTVFGMGAHVLLIRSRTCRTLRGVILMQTAGTSQVLNHTV